MDNLVDYRRYCENASDNSHNLDEKGVPAFILAHLQLGHRVRLVSEHNHRNRRHHNFVDAHCVVKALTMVVCINGFVLLFECIVFFSIISRKYV